MFSEMAGRPDFSAAGSQGSGQTLAMTSRPEVKVIREEQTTSLAAGSVETVEIYAPAGSVYNVLQLAIRAPVPGTAGAGDHTFRMKSGIQGRSQMVGTSDFSTDLNYNYSHFVTVTTATPSNEVIQAGIQERLRATENTPLRFDYANNLDVANANTREYYLVVEEVSY